ncbi:C2 and GRAM domain-containing protein At5g50170 [Linum perenne]
MKLFVYVLEARELPPVKQESYVVKLRLGKRKCKTRVLRNAIAVWNEEFQFQLHDPDADELIVSVYGHVGDGGLFSGGELVGRVSVPVRSVLVERDQSLPPTWFPLQFPGSAERVHANGGDCGKILLSMSVHEEGNDSPDKHFLSSDEDVKESETNFGGTHVSKSPHRKIPGGKKLIKAIANRLERVFTKHEEGDGGSPRTDVSSDITNASDYGDCFDEHPSAVSFEAGIQMMDSREDKQDMPDDLHGGVLLDQKYLVEPSDLNRLLFGPGSQFRKDLAEMQGTQDVEEGPWTWKSVGMCCLTRTVTYIKAASKLVKAVKATEEQSYVRVHGSEFCVFVSVVTPDVPYGNTFNVELMYKILPGPEQSSGEESCHLIISWGVTFHHSTMMKGMIEGGAKQGLKESFVQFGSLLAQNVKVLDSTSSSDKEHVLANLESVHESDLELAWHYFCNFTVASTVIMVIYVLVHILLCEPSQIQGLEFYGVDLPDSFGQLVTCAVLFIHVERVYYMATHFIEARLQQGSDHGVKSQGDGWILTVALIGGTSLASLGSADVCDPYVVFTCNGRTRTSSVKLQTNDPQWNDILEFDAMEELPSVLEVEVFDFDGPFDQATSLGHAEINFLKHTSTELADMWVPLEGKLAQSSQSKLHLRIFLNNNNGVETIKEYLTKMEREVGKKFNLRSPHRNSSFQKLFGLPPEEFLISDFTCQLKRKMPLQGRLFLSARIVGFYSNLFGHKTKFFFLWEDIDDVLVLPPTLSSVGSPMLMMVLRKDKGTEARQWAKSQDEHGRLEFYFQSFASFGVASRTIMALWRTRTLTPEQKALIAEEQEQDQGERHVMVEDSTPIVDAEDAKMTRITSLLEMFEGGEMEHRVMGKSGCLNYVTTPWESVKQGLQERHVSYKFNRNVSIFEGEVSCTQQKSAMIDKGEGWIVNEVMVLHDVPFCDHFHVIFRYQIEKSGLAHSACKCEVYAGITWLKATKFQQRMTRNITEKFSQRLKEIFELVEREILFEIQQGTPRLVSVSTAYPPQP